MGCRHSGRVGGRWAGLEEFLAIVVEASVCRCQADKLQGKQVRRRSPECGGNECWSSEGWMERGGATPAGVGETATGEGEVKDAQPSLLVPVLGGLGPWGRGGGVLAIGLDATPALLLAGPVACRLPVAVRAACLLVLLLAWAGEDKAGLVGTEPTEANTHVCLARPSSKGGGMHRPGNRDQGAEGPCKWQQMGNKLTTSGQAAFPVWPFSFFREPSHKRTRRLGHPHHTSQCHRCPPARLRVCVVGGCLISDQARPRCGCRCAPPFWIAGLQGVGESMPELGRWRLGPLARIRDLRRFHMALWARTSERNTAANSRVTIVCVQRNQFRPARFSSQPLRLLLPATVPSRRFQQAQPVVQVVIRKEVGGPYQP